MSESWVRDRYGRGLDDLRISVIDRCNFRCGFCMPAGKTYEFLPRHELLSFEEITRLARLFVELGVRKLRLTGGEPLLRSQIERLVEMLAAIPGVEDLALTTNGVLLAQKAKALRAAGLKRVTVSVESLDDEVFGRMNGVGQRLAPVLAGVEAANAAGLGPVKINTVVVRGVNDHELVPIARYFKERGCVVRFIEYMDVGTLNEWRPESVIPAREIVARIAAELPLEPIDRDRASEVAQRYRYLDDGTELGVISSITEPFCGDCTRARLSSDGRLYTCLFAADGIDLKRHLRSGIEDEGLRRLLVDLWTRRGDRYSEERARHLERRSELVKLGRDVPPPMEAPRVEMFRIGG